MLYAPGKEKEYNGVTRHDFLNSKVRVKLVYGKPYNAKIGTIQVRHQIRADVGSGVRFPPLDRNKVSFVHLLPPCPHDPQRRLAWPLRKDDTHKSRRVRPFFFSFDQITF